MADWTIRSALERARTIMQARATDPRLTAQEQSQAAENANQCTLTINALRANNTLAPSQRAGRATALEDRVFATIVIDSKYRLPAGDFYDGLDLMHDCAILIRLGLPTFWSMLSDGL